MALDKDQLIQKVKANYLARTGSTITEGVHLMLDDICKAVVDHIKEDAEVSVDVTGGSSSGTHTGTIS